MSDKQYIYVVLSKSSTILSSAINRLKGDDYTHAAVSLDKDLAYMFSFGRRRAWNPFVGCFKRESINDGVYKQMGTLPGVVIEIAVTPTQYQAVCSLLEGFLLDAHTYGYNYFGLAGNLVGASYGDSRRFFCSEFVYHVLHQSGICDLGIPRGIVRPQTLLKIEGRVIFEGNLKRYGKRLNTVLHTPQIFRFPQCDSGV